MKVYNFKALDESDKVIVNGVLTQTDEGESTIVMDRSIGNQDKVIHLNVEDRISHAGNFIASFIRRIDKDEVSKSVIVNRKRTQILREEIKKSESFYLIGDELYSLESKFKIKGIDGREVEMPISAIRGEVVELPIDGKYSRNGVINKLLYQKKVDYHLGVAMVKYLQNGLKDAAKFFKSNTAKESYYFVIVFDSAGRPSGVVNHGEVKPKEFGDGVDSVKNEKTKRRKELFHVTRSDVFSGGK